MIKFKLNKEEILEAVPYTLEDVGGDFNKAAVDAAQYTLVEKYNVGWERYESASRENMAHDELQPYFRAFLIHTGVDPEQTTNTEYMLWISRMWQKWREAHGIDRWAVIGAEERRQFERWLFETMPEK